MNHPVRTVTAKGDPPPRAHGRAVTAKPSVPQASGNRAFLFLQGPPGPLFHTLAAEMRERGVTVERINICAGDNVDWPGAAANFRGRFRDWPVYLDRFLRARGITDILLFGDCRPYHASAQRVAALRNIRTHVLEEGYLRPHWMTLELEGVNGYSRLRRDKSWFIDEAGRLAPEPELKPVTASFRRRVRDTARYYSAVHALNLTYPHYRSHRPDAPLAEALGWGWKYLVRDARARAAERTLAALAGKPFFLLPLQLSGDYQIRAHSPFPDMQSAAVYVMESFAGHAPPDANLLIKAHPLDSSLFGWARFIRRRARQLGIAGRVHFIDGGDLEDLAAATLGMICVNSTSATMALAEDRPVCVLGDAIYRIPGLTFEGHIDDFWTNPGRPEPGLYDHFRRVVVERCLIRGGLASESAVATLVENMAGKLCADPASYSFASQGPIAAK